MWRIGKVGGFLLGACFALLAGEAAATPVYDTAISAGDLTGSRSIGSGLVKGGGSFTTATLDWAITSNNDGSLHYHYAIDTNSQQGVSHFIFDLSDNCATDVNCFKNFSMTGGTGSQEWGTYTSHNGNPGMPGTIIGLKINVGSGVADFSFDFDSVRAPVWGDFYTKGGNGGTNGFALFNAGLGLELTSSLTNQFIAMPDNALCSAQLCGPPPCTTCGPPPCTENCGGNLPCTENCGDPPCTENCGNPPCTENCDNPPCTGNCGPPPSVPEPASIALLGVGLVGAGFARRRKKRT